MTVTPAGACVKGRGVDKRRQEPNPAAEAALRRQFYDRVLAGTLSLGEAVRQMRRISRLTQPEFASNRGVSVQALRQIEAGTGNPTVATLNKIASVFGLEVGFVRLGDKEVQ
jgi:DNA-binding XRE family transcriptional regulator